MDALENKHANSSCPCVVAREEELVKETYTLKDAKLEFFLTLSREKTLNRATCWTTNITAFQAET
jgi:hypothetical protein